MAKIIVNRAKGEDSLRYRERAYREHVEEGLRQKKADGRWLPKEEYEKKTGKPGKKEE